MISKEKLKEWLADSSYKPLISDGGKSGKCIYIKMPKNDAFDYIFKHVNYSGDVLQRDKNMDYCGIYNKQDGLVYDSYREFFGISPDIEFPHNKEQMAEMLTESVKEIIDQRVSDNRNNLDITEISSHEKMQSLVYFEQYVAEDAARKIFLNNQHENAIGFRCKYTFKGWTEENLLQYISDPDAFAQAEAKDYWENNQEEMLQQFIEKDLIKKELDQITDQNDSSLHRIRNIMQAVNLTSAKNVTVTIYKDETPFSFKTSADGLRRDPGGYYSTWDIAAKDRKAFEELFGRSADYTPDEITAITYNGKSIYEAEPLLPEESEDESEAEGFTMSM